MASYYAFPPSNPYPVVGPNTPQDPHQRPSSTLIDRLQTYPPDVYNTSPPAAQPLHPYPGQPARFMGRTYSRPDSPAQTGRSSPGWPVPQAPECPAPVQRTHKTFVQWKAEAQATTAEYQRNGFCSPVAWVTFANYFRLFRDLRIS